MLTDASNMAQRFWHFTVIKKGILDHVLDSNEILQELTEKSLLKYIAQKKNSDFFKNKLGEPLFLQT
jgi:hypothetical protein